MRRMQRIKCYLFACRWPVTAEWLMRQTHVQVAGVQHLLRLLERVGRAEVCDVTPDGRPRWGWKEGLRNHHLSEYPQPSLANVGLLDALQRHLHHFLPVSGGE